MRKGIGPAAVSVGVLVALGAAAPPATAIKHHFKGPTVVETYPGDSRFGPEFTISADDGPNVVIVGFDHDNGTYRVSDVRGVKSVSCDRISATEVECAPPTKLRHVYIEVKLGAGDDSLSIDSDVIYDSSLLEGGIGENMIRGGRGDDRIHGAPQGGGSRYEGNAGDDILIGTYNAPDTLIGGAGHDELTGRTGADRVRGGSGDDRLDVRDYDKDAEINCGSGKDTARVDDRDPQSVECERVLAPKPGGGHK